jgi:hypothetical protein
MGGRNKNKNENQKNIFKPIVCLYTPEERFPPPIIPPYYFFHFTNELFAKRIETG